MSKLDNWIDNKIAQNLFIWFFLFLILLTAIQADNRVLTSLFVVVLLAPAVYINNLLILPYLRKNIALCLLLFSGNAFLFSVINIFLIKSIEDQTFHWGMLVNFLGIMILALTFSSAIKLSRDSFVRRQQEKEAELKLLKAQLNPHFLFNTLNNLYGLSVVKSDKLPGLMLKLSDLLRYSLYETKEALVPLNKEIEYLENYIALEKIRLEDTADIQFTKVGDLASKKIAPMLFIVFVENAFKHLDTVKGDKSTVSIILKEENNQLTFMCKNSMEILDLANEDIEKGKSGIGLQNAKKRLALMYQKKYSLHITTTNNTYTVALILDL